MLVHRRVEIGRRARQFDRLLVVALDMRKGAGKAPLSAEEIETEGAARNAWRERSNSPSICRATQ
jgi:hypothetical protein